MLARQMTLGPEILETICCANRDNQTGIPAYYADTRQGACRILLRGVGGFRFLS